MAKLLIVDDDPGTLAWMSSALEAAGHEVRTFDSAWPALVVTRAWSPDLILTDILMPDMDGFAFSRLVRAHERVPIVFVSVLQRQAEAVLRGVAGYVQKPVTAAELRAAVDHLLGASGAAPILVVDDAADIRACYRLILEPRFEVREAENGLQALEVLSREPIALAIVDVHMPVMNGVELLRAMRADPRFATIPVVVQTSDQAAIRAPVWTHLHVAQTLLKDEFMSWLIGVIEDHLAGDG